MKTCPICRFNNTDGEETCFRCSASLAGGRDPVVAKLAMRRGPPGAYWISNRAAVAMGSFRRRIVNFVKWWGAPPPDTIMIRRPLVSAALAILPGVGQLYNGQPRKAFLFLAGWILAVSLVVRTFYEPVSDWVCLGAILWAIYAFHDGFKTAVAVINRSPWSLRRSFGFFMVWIFDAGMLALISQWGLSMTALRFKSISQDVFAPAFRAGDRVLIDTWSYKVGSPRVGDLVYYDPAQFSLDEEGKDPGDNPLQDFNRFIIDAADDFERVVAGPGQAFERRGGVYYRDGVAIPPGEGPIVEGVALGDFSVAAPADSYIILPSHIPSELGWSELETSVAGAAAPSGFNIAHNESWKKACVVPGAKIKGRVFSVYYPPRRRQWIRRPPESGAR